MPDHDLLKRANVVYLGIDLDDQLEGGTAVEMDASPVVRSDGSLISLLALHDLLEAFDVRRQSGVWDKDRASSDGWLAPRVHAALRLDRAQSSDRGVWHWLAVHSGAAYVQWRWEGDKGIANERWYGPIHKQALARLWWGAEIFRDGGDYTPVERAFKRQDLINSYLHRPLVRCRSFALGVVNVLASENEDALPARQVNDLARVLNLCTAGRPPELHVHFQTDDMDAALTWASSDAPVPPDWDPLPSGPQAVDTTEASIGGGTSLAAHGMVLAGIRPAADA